MSDPGDKFGLSKGPGGDDDYDVAAAEKARRDASNLTDTIASFGMGAPPISSFAVGALPISRVVRKLRGIKN